MSINLVKKIRFGSFDVFRKTNISTNILANIECESDACVVYFKHPISKKISVYLNIVKVYVFSGLITRPFRIK